MTWEKPKDDGGTEITGYIIEKRDANRQTWTIVTTTADLEYVVMKLVANNKYIMRVSAKNEVGQSEPVETQPITAKYTFGEYY